MKNVGKGMWGKKNGSHENQSLSPHLKKDRK